MIDLDLSHWNVKLAIAIGVGGIAFLIIWILFWEWVTKSVPSGVK